MADNVLPHAEVAVLRNLGRSEAEPACGCCASVSPLFHWLLSPWMAIFC